MWGAVAGAIGGSLLQMGGNAAAAAQNAAITRSLRRTAYQDQMHSMRQAGLNPILAAGAQPGYSNTGTMQPPDVSNAVDSAFRASKNKEERALLDAQKDTALANARQAQAQADTAEALRDSQRRNLDAGSADKEQEARTGFQREHNVYTDTMLKRQEWRANLPQVIRDQRQAEAGLTTAREIGVRAENVGKEVDARWIADYEGMIRAGKTADEIIDRLGPIAAGLLRGRAQRQGDVRERNTNARDAQRQEREHRDTVTREREQDRRDRAEQRRQDNGSRY